jgi:uncharacterized protein
MVVCVASGHLPISRISKVMLPLTTGFYAALLGCMFAVLGLRTVRMRRRLRNPEMQRAARIHANFAEYVPFCLGLVYLTEAHGAPAWLLHSLGSLLLLARLSHAYGLDRESMRFRVVGVTTTLGVLLTACAYLLFNFWK